MTVSQCGAAASFEAEYDIVTVSQCGAAGRPWIAARGKCCYTEFTGEAPGQPVQAGQAGERNRPVNMDHSDKEMLMKKRGFARAAAVMCACVLMALSLSACSNKGKEPEKADEETVAAAKEAAGVSPEVEEDANAKAAANAEANANARAEAAKADAAANAETDAEAQADAAGADLEKEGVEYIQQFIGEMDLTGSWEDEVSKRAGMDVEQNEDGTYYIRVHWGASATETAIWEIRGHYDEVSGMLAYYEGLYTVHSFDENNNETIIDEDTTEGAFMKEGDKLRWKDSKNSEEGLFVRVK